MLTDRTTYETSEKYQASGAPFIEEETSVVGIANVLLRSRVVILASGLLVGAAAVANARLRPQYTATSMFVPQATERGTSQLAGLAAQFGFSVAGTSNGDGPDFYAQLIKSRDLLREAALTKYPLDSSSSADSVRRTLVQLFAASGPTADLRASRTVDRLDELVSARADLKVGIVTLRTSAKTPELAVDINRRLLALVSDFNIRKRRSQAAAERQFVEERMKNAQASLDTAEQRLADFMSSNRGYHSSPQLSTEASRLQRRVDLEQEVYTTLAKSAEQARIEEVRNTPVVTVIDQPGNGVKRTSLGTLSSVVLGGIVGMIIAIAVILTREFLSRQRVAHGEDFAEFDRIRRSLFRKSAAS